MSKPSKKSIDLDQRPDHAKALRLWTHAAGKQTGPKTPEGRFRSGQRSRKHGLRSGDGIAMARWLASVNRLVKSLAAQ
jgi:hypothetical protein